MGVAKLLNVLLLGCVVAAGAVVAAELAARDAKILEASGIPLYPGARYAGGVFQGIMGVRFAASGSVDEVRQWYREKLPDWSLFSEFGGWILYRGKPGADMPAVMGARQVAVAKKEQLPEWYDLPADMTTEIIIVVPDAKPDP